MSKRKINIVVPKSSDIRNFGVEDPEKKRARSEKDQEDTESAGSYKETLLATLTDPGWKKALADEFEKPYFNAITNFLAKEEKAKKEIFPPKHEIFTAFNETPFDKVKVVIIGQDPYHDNNQAHGMCFSVKKGVTVPPSLVNMYKELETDIPGFKRPKHGYLINWAQQGILLINATLTVEAHKANSHEKIGWQIFTDAVIEILNKEKKDLVFLLLGGFAQKKGKALDKKRHTIITAAHPSPLSVKKFLGSKVFSKVNEALKAYGEEPIDWTVPE